MIKIILTDWAGYPLKRRKRIKRNIVKCGLSRILKCMAEFDSGHAFDCTLIVNASANFPETSSYRLPTPSFLQYKENSKATYLGLKEIYPFISEVIFRDNTGMDIGAYDLGIEHLRNKGYTGDVILMNSSVAPTDTSGWLRKYYDLFHKHERTGLCGITVNSSNTCIRPPPFAPHVQSYFLYTNMGILNEVMPEGFQKFDLTLKNKDKLVEQGEIGISQLILAAGYGIICSSFPNFIYFSGSKWSIPKGDIRSQRKFRSIVNKM